jgi:hypothetical protein
VRLVDAELWLLSPGCAAVICTVPTPTMVIIPEDEMSAIEESELL